MTNKSILKIILIYLFFIPFHISYGEASEQNSAPPSKNIPSEKKDLSPIKLGISINPNEIFLKEFRAGFQAYFKKINDRGGINGHLIELIVMDDKRDPVITAHNVREFIDKDNVLAIIIAGSANVLVTLPIINEKHVLLYAPYAGSEFLYTHPPFHYVINFSTGSGKGSEIIIKNLLDNGFKPEEMAFFLQNDPFGDSYYKGSMDALKKFGYPNPEKLPYGRYSRATMNVEGGVANLLRDARANKFEIKVIISATTPPGDVEFVKLVKQLIPNALIVNSGSSITYSDFTGLDFNFIASQTVPSPFDISLPAVREYQEDFKKYQSDLKYSQSSLHGYLRAKILNIALSRALEANNLTREGLIDAFESFRDVDIGIVEKITIDKDDHTLLNKSYLMLIKDGKPIPIEWTDLNKLKSRNGSP